jgi:phytanoyl-CoA hydroxylase
MADNSEFELTADERATYDRDGYVVRRDVFAPAEVAEIADSCEVLLADVISDRVSHRMKVGSYVFDPDFVRGVMIKWEGDTDAVHGIEPFAHLSPVLNRWAHDDRLLHPMRAIVDDPEPILFTEKLNLKRPRLGGPNPLHQDYPYWLDSAQDPTRVATTILYLDDSHIGNGCTWVVPGSHRSGMWRTRQDTDTFGQNELDADAYPDITPVPVEVPAGSTVSFGSMMVHQSTPNRSDTQRRALLFSYQPAGHPTMIEALRRLADKVS